MDTGTVGQRERVIRRLATGRPLPNPRRGEELARQEVQRPDGVLPEWAAVAVFNCRVGADRRATVLADLIADPLVPVALQVLKMLGRGCDVEIVRWHYYFTDAELAAATPVIRAAVVSRSGEPDLATAAEEALRGRSLAPPQGCPGFSG